MIRICLITIHKGLKEPLLKTVNSVFNYLDYEIFVGYLIYESGNVSLDFGEIKNKKCIYYSGQDSKGITNALNTSQKLAKRNFCNATHYAYIHSGDVFCPDKNALKKLTYLSGLNYSYDIITWSYIFNSKNERSIFLPKFNSINKGMTIPHIGTFISNDLHERLNGYRDEFKFAMDYDFFLRAHQICSYIEFRDVLVEIDGEGLSSINPYKTFREVLKIKLKIKDLTIRNLILSIYVFLMNTIKRVIYDLLSKNPQFRKKLRLLVNSRIKG